MRAGLPKALRPSRVAASMSATRVSGEETTRIPLPPPPAAAFSSTGRRIRPTAATRSGTELLGSVVPAMTGTPAATASALAAALSPKRRSTPASGPMKAMPAASSAAAKSAFSARNPYPG